MFKWWFAIIASPPWELDGYVVDLVGVAGFGKDLLPHFLKKFLTLALEIWCVSIRAKITCFFFHSWF